MFLQSFWYHPNVSPPKDYAKLGRHDHAVRASIWSIATASTKWPAGTSRYGTSPTSTSGRERRAQKTYFELYDHTARDVKAVSPRLRIGGPATAQAAWIPDMIKHAEQAHVPLDFVSTHVYGNDTAERRIRHRAKIFRATRWSADR